jgi:hypothetical protein
VGDNFWAQISTFLGIFGTALMVGIVLTHSGQFALIVEQAGKTTSNLFHEMSFQG